MRLEILDILRVETSDLKFEIQISDVIFWISNFRFSIPDFSTFQNSYFRFWNLGFIFYILDFRYEISDVRFQWISDFRIKLKLNGFDTSA